ncbi:MAG: XdhC/CoxI family protein [Phycisphaerales bacterium]
MSNAAFHILAHALALARAGERGALCVVVRSRGSTPQSSGALMLVDERAEILGTIGGGCVEADVRRRAFEMLREGRSGMMRFTLDHDYGWDDGLICGGTIEVAVAPLPASTRLAAVVAAMARREATSLELDVEAAGAPGGPGDAAVEGRGRADGVATTTANRRRFVLELPPPERLYIAGAGHVGQALARLAAPLGFDVTLFDDRTDLLERFAPAGCAKVSGDIAGSLRDATMDDLTYGVVVTRGHRHDEQALAALLGRGARYVGMIGSRRKVRLVFDDLRERGVADDELARVHAPIGLPIGGVTVEEIALSIAAQLVMVRRQHPFAPVRERGADVEAIRAAGSVPPCAAEHVRAGTVADTPCGRNG